MKMHENTFNYLQPTPEQAEQMQQVRDAATTFADVIEMAIPDGPDKTHVLRTLRTAMMWANVAITRQPDGAPRGASSFEV
jgi:hypothetical protein